MTRISRTTRRAATLAVLGCGGASIAMVLAACGTTTVQPDSQTGAANASGSSRMPSSPSSASPGTQSRSVIPASNQCPATALHATVNRTQGGAAAGTDYVALDFTNVSAHSCVLFGFPGVSWVSGQPGSQLGNAASRVTSDSSVNVTLAPGAVAHAWLGIADAGNFPAATCKPVTAHWLRVYPPDQFGSVYVPFSAQVCSAKITGGSTPLSVMPVRAGAGTSGIVP
ncbi:MAG TPA: DUF4232 domain-containing protein [Streptosporangiaceae bacterium]